MRNGRDRIFVPRRSRRGIVQVPNPAMHSSAGRELARLANPVQRDQLLLQILFGDFRLVGARKPAHEMALRIKNFDA